MSVLKTYVFNNKTSTEQNFKKKMTDFKYNQEQMNQLLVKFQAGETIAIQDQPTAHAYYKKQEEIQKAKDDAEVGLGSEIRQDFDMDRHE
jgi:hypothetical protein